ILFAPLPPELPGQRDISYEAKPEVTKTAEPAGLRQPLLVWDIPTTDANRKVIGVNITYSAELLSRKLVPLGPGETPPDVPPLPLEQRAAFTASSTLLDFHLPAFQEWLAQHRLRPTGDETDLDFGRRLFLHLKEEAAFEFKEDLDRRPSRVCQTMKSDCAGLTALYVAVMRASGIPARQIVGRWALSAKKDEMLYGKPWQQEHVKAEFFTAGIGWVPVDISAAVDFDKVPGSLERFASDAGDFLAFHIDAEMTLDVPKLGRRTVQYLQEPAVYSLGPGTFDGQIKRSEWTVDHRWPGR
ncbi:MAG: transglutaminase-like domain-containing protein, partial [Tepidisphaeraceae bacterium]